MSRHRFYAPDASRSGQVVTLPDQEAHQLRRVLRLRQGAAVRVFDGYGHEFEGHVDTINRKRVSITTGAPTEPAAEPQVSLTLAATVLKSRGLDGVIRDATMLGVSVIRPLRSDRSVALARDEATLTRWRAIAIASAKQSGRAVVPVVQQLTPFDELVRTSRCDINLLLVEPSLALPHEHVSVLAERPAPSSAAIAVGPEGGWTDDEARAAIDAGFLPLTLGTRTLRANAAPSAAIAVLQYVWHDL